MVVVYTVEKAYRMGKDGNPVQSGWHLFSTTDGPYAMKEWCQTFGTKREALEAAKWCEEQDKHGL